MATRNDPDGTAEASPSSAPGNFVSQSASIEEPVSLESLRIVGEGEYRLLEEIDRGAMGKVVRAEDCRHRREVAIKLLLGDRPGARARFLREAQIAARLSHPSIVPVHEIGRLPGGQPFIAMVRVEGRRLDEAVAAAASTAERLALLPCVLAAIDALAYAHAAGVIHRDLKPQNILLGAYGETIVVDWGLAKLAAQPDLDEDDDPATVGNPLTVAGATVGTPAYMPPEQAEGRPADRRSDVYSLGAVLYHVCAGAPPYRGPTDEVLAAVRAGPPPPAERAARIPPELASLVGKAMARRPEERYPSASELADDLRRYLVGGRVRAHVYSTGLLLRRWVSRNSGMVVVAAVLSAMLLVTGGVGLSEVVRQRDRANELAGVARTARTDETRRRAAAEDLIDFMLQKLRDRLEPVGRLDILGEVGDRVLHYYEAAEAPGDAADIDVRRGQLAAAETEVGEALALLAPMSADDAIVRELLGRAYLVAGDLAARHGRGGATERARAAALLEPLAQKHVLSPQLVARLRRVR